MNYNEFIKRFISSILLIPLIVFIVIIGSYSFTFFLYLCFAISTFEWVNMSTSKKYLVPGLFVLMLSFYSAYKIRFTNYDEIDGALLFLFILFICVLTDLGGYFFGKILKGPKLSKISPKKTISGFVGGFILPLLIFYLLTKSKILIFDNNYLDVNFKLIIFFIITTSFISQIGDLTISYFKRLSGIKNSGKIIPGHGGILDRIDGMIFVFLISYFLYLK
tara:strand:- start:3017 stop:3676 length:660 start_codon:yes stop_codon:yes gene_type:complete